MHAYRCMSRVDGFEEAQWLSKPQFQTFSACALARLHGAIATVVATGDSNNKPLS